MKIGLLCVKIAGRDAGQKAVVIDILDKNMVLIDGNTRRRKCNFSHLEVIGELKVKAKASHADVVDAMRKAGIEVVKRAGSRERKERAPKKRKVKAKKEKGKKET